MEELETLPEEGDPGQELSKEHSPEAAPEPSEVAHEETAVESNAPSEVAVEGAPVPEENAAEEAVPDACQDVAQTHPPSASRPESTALDSTISEDSANPVPEEPAGNPTESAPPAMSTLEAASAEGTPPPAEAAETSETAPPENSDQLPIGETPSAPLLSMEEWLAQSEDAATEAPPPVPVEDSQLRAVLEAIVYIAEEPLTILQIASALNQPVDRVQELLGQLVAEFEKPEHGLTIREVAGGFKMATKAEHHETVRNFVKNLKPPLKLSLPALETLAVIAYKQPVTAPEIQEIRGVRGAGVLNTLLDRKLIASAGRKNVIGKPILYKTTKEFLIQFGLKDLSELPSLKEFEEIRRMAFADSDVEPAAESAPAESAPAGIAAEPAAAESAPAEPASAETAPAATAESAESAEPSTPPASPEPNSPVGVAAEPSEPETPPQEN